MANLQVNSWYVLQVAPNMEMRVASELEAKGYEGFSPMYLKKRYWLDRTRISEAPLFPGYVFFRLTRDCAGLVVATVGVRRIVAFGGRPCPVQEQEISALKRVIDSKAEALPYAFVREGEKVRIGEGPLMGLEGTVIRNMKSQKLIISVDILQRSIAVNIQGYNIESVAAAPTLNMVAA